MNKEIEQLKKQYDKVRDSATLKKHKILSKAYKIGKKEYGHNSYSVVKLALDFEIPYTTAKRVLSLDRANPRTWKLIEQGKLSAFKAAMICHLKCITYQDEIVDLVMEKNLSTYEIKKLRISDWKDVRKEKLRLAVENGFARKSVAYKSLKETIERMNCLLELEEDELPPAKFPDLKKELKTLNKKIDKFLEEKIK